MSNVLFSVLAATSLAASGIGAGGETRSAQSLPAEHLVTPAQPAAAAHLHGVNRLADTTMNSPESDSMAKSKCEHTGGHWDEAKMKCRRMSPVVYFIGAGTIGGFIYSMTSRGNGGSSAQPPISN